MYLVWRKLEINVLWGSLICTSRYNTRVLGSEREKEREREEMELRGLHICTFKQGLWGSCKLPENL